MANNRKKKTKKTSPVTVFLVAILCLILGMVCGFAGNVYFAATTYSIPGTVPFTPVKKPSSESGAYDETVIRNKDLSIHFLELGNKYTGDCTLIKVGNTEVLIDAGSKSSSVPTIKEYVDRYCTDGILEYVIVTHAHEDHYAGFATSANTDSIFDLYDCRTIITFSQTTNGKEKQNMYKNFVRELNDEVAAGATHLSAKDCAGQTFDLGNDVKLKILDSKYYYEASATENNHSVCTLITQGEGETEKNYLFTGDLEVDGEAELVKRNDLPHVDLYKAGHHGSKTSSTTALMEAVQPATICVCCCAGSPEYTKTNANQFPTQEFVDRVAPYTSAVYVTSLCVDYSAGEFTSMNGNIAVCADRTDETPTVYCSYSATVLKDSEWFRNNRTVPTAWEN